VAKVGRVFGELGGKGGGMIEEARLANLEDLRTHRDVGDFKTPLTVGESSRFGIAFNVYQSARKRFAGDTVNDAADCGE
jgi:hypothetical protein